VIRGEERGWFWGREIEDHLAAGGHTTVETDAVVIAYGDDFEEAWVIEGLTDEEASLIAASPKLLRTAEELLDQLQKMDWVPASAYTLLNLVHQIREGQYGKIWF